MDKDEYRYDSKGNLLEDIYYEWNADHWENSMKYEFTHDGNGNKTLNVSYLWNGSEWEYTYDNSFSYEDLILPMASIDEGEGFDLELTFKHKLTHMILYGSDGENWVFNSDYIFEYSDQGITAIRESKSETQLTLYPNPAAGQVTFTLDAAVDPFRVEMFDIQGKMVSSQTVENNKPVSIESLQEGVYFYRLNAQGQSYSGKLMVKNHYK